jgi:murein DD-endopeptidase MepM/ murein hydrolase activator NlpD
VEPDWERVRTWETDSIVGTEVAARVTHSVNYATLVEKLADTVSLTVQQPHVWILFNEHRQTGETICFLASLLPDESYDGDPSLLGSNPEGSDYTGIAIYSETDGTPLYGRRFEAGEITNTLLFDETSDEEIDPDVRIGMGIDSETGTRAEHEYLIETVACVAKSDPPKEPIIPDRGREDVIDQGSGNNDGTGGVPAPSNNDDDDEDADVEFTVTVSASPTRGGTVAGGGFYPKNSSVTLTATPNEGYEFIGWIGGGSTKTYNSTSSTLTVTVTENMELTARFSGGNGEDEDKLPCGDEANNKVNPLVKMELAAPVPWNIAGATFGNTRQYSDGRPKYHNGIDLAGPVGTPVYAQSDGVIGGTIVSNQPNKILVNGRSVYPPGYSGDKNDGGNRLSVISTINGKTVTNSYMHLQAGNPFGINPRTGSPWTLNDRIYTGEIIGYIGVSGNAGAAVPHLHLTTKENGGDVNPTKYLNATVSTSITTITTPCD